MIIQIFKRKPKIDVHSAAESVFNKLYKEELKRTSSRLYRYFNGVRSENLRLTVLSLFVFITEYSTYTVYGHNKISKKILKSFYALLKLEYTKEYERIIEQAKKLSEVYYSRPEDPLFGLGMYFSRCINPRKDYLNLLLAMSGTTETSKKSRLIINFYNQLNSEYRI
jgi:hypothetical protein